MPTTIDDILISPYYSAEAVGGAEFGTAIVRSGPGGAISHRNLNLEDYVSKYEIDYDNLDQFKQSNLRSFTILRQGQARAFLFLAPDAYQINNEYVGWLNPATGEVAFLGATNGTLTDFYAIKNYSDPFNSYNRRLCKLSPYEPFRVEFFDASDLNASLGFTEFAADPFPQFYYQPIAVSKSQNIGVKSGLRTVTIFYREGRIQITPALPAGTVVKLTGQYLLPVVFNDDWMKFSVDETTISSFKIGVTEVLPAELGVV